jgi:hypothetical protein
MASKKLTTAASATPMRVATIVVISSRVLLRMERTLTESKLTEHSLTAEAWPWRWRWRWEV